MKVTVTLGSSRPGGIDIALAGLCHQTFQDFEVVFVDGRYHQRHQRVLDAVKASGLKQPFYHVPNHRFGDGIWGTACAGYNTGFALADGDLIVMLLDYAYAPPMWLEHHVRHAGKLVMAPHEYRRLTGVQTLDGEPAGELLKLPVDCMGIDRAIAEVQRARTRYDEISCFPEPFRPDQLDVFPIENSSIPPVADEQPYFFSTKNESFPRENVFKCNGMRELWDRGRGPGDPDLGYRLHWTGLEPVIVREAIVHCLNPRVILPNMNIVAPELGQMPPPYHERISVELGNDIYNTIRAREEAWCDNPIALTELRDRLWHWREMSRYPDPCIPRNVVSDAEYFRKEAA